MVAKTIDAKYTKAARRAASRLYELLRLERGAFNLVLVYAIGIGLASLAAPIGVQMLVSAIAFGGLVQPIVVLSFMVLVALAFAAVLKAVQAWLVENVQQRLFVRVACDLAARLPRLSKSVHDEHYAPELVNRFFDVMTVQKGAAMILLDAIFVALQVIVGTVLLAFYHPALLAFSATLLLSIVGVFALLGKGGAATSIQESSAKYELANWFEDVARHDSIFRGPTRERYAVERSEELVRGYIDLRQAHYRIVFRQIVAFVALQALATAALLGIGGYLVLGGQLTLGQLVAAELIVTGIVAGFSKLGKYLEVYYDLIAAMDKLGQLVDLPLDDAADIPTPPPSSTQAPKAPLAIRVVEASVDLGADRGDALSNVSFDIAAGEHVAILGANGAGKSTLIDVLSGAREPRGGRVELDGFPRRDIVLAEHGALATEPNRSPIQEEIALVRGREAIFGGTVLENLCVGRRDISLDEVRSALETVGMWEKVTSLPEGAQTELLTNGKNLSLGEVQRLALARELLTKPRCLLLDDDALDHVDPASRKGILGRILDPTAPWTAVIASVDPTVAQMCPRVLVLGNGELLPLRDAAASPPSSSGGGGSGGREVLITSGAS